MGPLISPAELRSLLHPASHRPVLLDATALLPGERFDPAAAFEAKHIPGARRFDLGLFSDPEGTLPHMVPSQGRFARLFGELGVSNSSEVVFYDQTGVAGAARGWWLAALFGHDRARVLDGGLPAWLAEGGAVETGTPEPVVPGHFVPAPRFRRLVGLGDMMDLSRNGGARLLDARGAGRFEASVPEPRAGLPGGHVPGAANLPYTALLLDGRFLPPAALRARFLEAGVAAGHPVVASCGSGLTAAVLCLGLEICGLGPASLYDGSWTEWAQSPLPRETGPAATGVAA